jgi:EmrB/QacA subfamily drug resistance transporter
MSNDLVGRTAGSAQPRNFRITALIIASALFMEQLDSTVLTTALPAMAETFGVPALHMSLALTSYLLSLAVFIPASGKVADKFGARRVFCWAIAIFTVGSILCAQSNSLGFLVFARMLQGLGGAMMVPVGRLVMLRTVPKADFVAAMAWLLIPALIGPILGPPVGGMMVSYLSWRWIFYINVPIGIVGIGLALMFIDDVRETSTGRFDFIGLALAGISLVCLTFGLEMSGRGVASLATMSLIISAGVIAGLLYIQHARRHPDPILDFRLMRIPTFRMSVIAGSLSRIMAGSAPFLLPLMLQIGFGMSAVESGMITFLGAVGSMAMKAAASPVLRRYGFRTTMIWNGITATLSVAAMAAFRPEWPLWTIYAVLLIGGFFQSLQFVAYNTIAYADVPRDRMSAATSFYTTFQQLTLSLGICIASATLAATVYLGGHAHATNDDFSIAILVVAGISMLAIPACARLPRDAGADMSGHRQTPVAKPAE